MIAAKEPTLPYLVYQQIGRTSVLSFDGTNALQQARFRFSCYGSTYRNAKVFAEQVKALFDGLSEPQALSDGSFVDNVLPLTEIDTAEEQLHGTVYSTHVDYYIWFLDVGSTS